MIRVIREDGLVSNWVIFLAVALPILLLNMITPTIRSHETIVGTVETVRIASVMEKQESGHDDVVGGAIVGGLVAGPVGAVVGAIAGKGKSKVVLVEKTKMCKFTAQIDKVSVAYTPYSVFGPSSDVILCSMFRVGDKVNVEKITLRDGTIQYRWQDNIGEVLLER